MRFPEIPADLSTLSDDELSALLDEFVTAFNDATPDGVQLTDDDVATLTGATESIETLRSEQQGRSEQAAERSARIAELASRVNATDSADSEGDGETGAEEEGGNEESTEGEDTQEDGEDD